MLQTWSLLKSRPIKTRKYLPIRSRQLRWCSSESAPQPHQYLAFYKYANIKDPESAVKDMRNRLETLGGLGRIYIGAEGINAQMSVPTVCYPALKYTLQDFVKKWKVGELVMNEGQVASMKTAEETPFTKLIVKQRSRIVQDALPSELDGTLNMEATSTLALSPRDWHERIANPIGEKPLVVDTRNYYESQIGLFEGAVRLPVDRFAESFQALDQILESEKPDREVLLYCTGGIRCEKIGAYLTQVKGRKNVHTLQGGINRYAKYVEEMGLNSIYKGINYQFDKRNKFGLEKEAVTEDKLAKCAACGKPESHMWNCSNPVCNILIVLCDSCHAKQHGSCSSECEQVALMSPSERLAYERAHEIRASYVGPNQKFVRSKALLEEVLKEQSAIAYRMQGSDIPQKINEPELNPAANVREDAYSKLKGIEKVMADNQRRAEGNAKITPTIVQDYVENWTTPASKQLAHIHDIISQSPRSAISVGPYQGQSLKILTRITKAKRVLEIGTFLGYSALCFAEGLPADGIVYSCDVDSQALEIAGQNIKSHPLGQKVQLYNLTGKQMLDEVVKQGTQFDLIFIDADKHSFSSYYDTIFDQKLLSESGILVVDNTLWRGEVAEQSALEPNADTETKQKPTKEHIVHLFNKRVHSDPRTTQVILPVRDGITMITWADHPK